MYYVYYLKMSGYLSKIGQWPSVADFQIPQAEKYRKILGEEQYKELTRGISLAAHGVGIGSYVYLRRVFENLIEEAFKFGKDNPNLCRNCPSDATVEKQKIELTKNNVEIFRTFTLLDKKTKIEIIIPILK